MLAQNTRLITLVAVVAFLLLIPFVAMQFTQEVNWTMSDFVIAGFLLLGTGLACELVLRKVRSLKQRLILCGVILLALALVWVELAVGLFGTPFAGN